MTVEESREQRRHYPTPPPDSRDDAPPIVESADGSANGSSYTQQQRTLVAELRNGRHANSRSPVGDDVDGSASSGRSSSVGAESTASTAKDPAGDAEKVLKLSPNRLGEFLADTPMAFARQPSSSSSTPSSGNASPTVVGTTAASARGGRSSTITAPPTPPVLDTSTVLPSPRPPTNRTLSTPPVLWTRGQRSGKAPQPEQIEIPASQSKPSTEDGGSGGTAAEKRRQAAMSTLGLQMAVDGEGGDQSAAAATRDEVRKPGLSTPSTAFSSPVPTAVFPPLPLHSYLSLALSANTPGSSSAPQASSSTGETFSPRKAEANVYGPPPHNPDNSAAIAMERLQNFFLIPPVLEGAVMFGVFACLDSWLYIFTILPLRFLKGMGVLLSFWREWIWDYFHHYDGNKLRKHRRRSSAALQSGDDGMSSPPSTKKKKRKVRKRASDLLPSHKADIMRGLMLFTTCWVLMRLDASKMYHSIRATNGIKLYIIYNMLDFGDKLCAALGQDIFECLFSDTALERRPDGRSKIWRPLGFLVLGMAYNILHSIVLFYQVITLNVAVNSYSNALTTLLLSVQFVELKGSVFKRLDKENLFQMTCADIVERFQLWLMLVIIGARNMVEMGVWTLSSSSGSTGSALPKSFTFFPSWTGQLMGPFFMVLGSEMLVDWLKHAYITKFNNIRPMVYERYLDIQCKDFYSHAFSFQNLTKRFGLPVLPLACVFIRSTIQTYHQFLATHVPSVFPPSSSTSLTPTSTPDATSSLDHLLHRALSRHSPDTSWTDQLVSVGTMFTFLLACFLVFLSVKLILGVLLLGFARRRYRGIKERERMNCAVGGRYGGAHGVVNVGKDERKRIWEGDEKGLKACEERERKGREAELKKEMDGLEKVKRYEMSSKRIW